MAKQDGIIEIKGTIGNLTFSRGKGGFIVKRKSSLSGDRIKTDPKFVRTRENLTEFAQAAKTAKRIRLALASLIKNLKDGDLLIRLNSACFKILQTDTTHTRGNRTVQAGNFNLLQDFQFNIKAPLSETIAAPYITTINRPSGEMTIQVPPFVPDRAVNMPVGATHFQLTAAVLSLDLVSTTTEMQEERSAILPWNSLATAAINLDMAVFPDTTNPIFLAYGIEFYQELNGVKYLLKNGAFTALSIVKVDIAH